MILAKMSPRFGLMNLGPFSFTCLTVNNTIQSILFSIIFNNVYSLHGHRSCKRGWQQLTELLPGSFHKSCDHQFTAPSRGKHVTQVAEESYHLLPEFHSAVFRLWGLQFPCTMLTYMYKRCFMFI